jgi:hypothetical protein
MNYDGDGEHDLVVKCSDKPGNGVCFCENTAGDRVMNAMPVFKPGPGISTGLQNVRVNCRTENRAWFRLAKGIRTFS